MVGPWPSSLQVSSSSTLISVKFKSLIHALIFSHVCRFTRAVSRAVSSLCHLLKQNYPPATAMIGFKKSKNKNKNKILFGSFRLHYNWCSSSHVMPVATWGSAEGGGGGEGAELSGYLRWLEERKEGEGDGNEIDELAEMFIASCHEQFRLEKQESYRRFQEMMARSM